RTGLEMTSYGRSLTRRQEILRPVLPAHATTGVLWRLKHHRSPKTADQITKDCLLRENPESVVSDPLLCTLDAVGFPFNPEKPNTTRLAGLTKRASRWSALFIFDSVVRTQSTNAHPKTHRYPTQPFLQQQLETTYNQKE